jgi:glycosyltransferase involved in cell wall biosynthesis
MIRVLVLNSDMDGVGYYRTLNPHLCMHNPEIKIEIRLLNDMTLPLLDPKFLRHYDIISYNKMIPFSKQEHIDLFYKMCKDFNIKLIYDIDDYWVLDPTHINYKNWMKNKSGKKIEEVIKAADVVTTTTEIFAEKIRELNPNVIVLPNALNIEEQQWKSKKTKSNRIRFIWGGGISHMVDLRLIQDDFKTFKKTFLEKAQLIMCGYDLRIKMTDGNIRKDKHNKSQWGLFESFFTANGKYTHDLKYREFLNTSDNFDNDNLYGYNKEFLDQFYQRRHTKPILLYGTMYNEADISLAPLKNKLSFNKMKSQLKLIEAGCHKMPIIMSNYGPYTLDDVEGKNSKQKGWLINEGESWVKKMQWYLDNPNAIIDHGEANHEYFLENFEMKIVNKKRENLYQFVATQDRTNVKL